MKILKHDYCNPAISVHINEITLESTGLYLLAGENGSGKTSVIENILRKRKIDVMGGYKDSISYFCQEDKRYNISVYDYLASNKSKQKDEILKMLGIDYFHKNITQLSGGEYTKVRFARTILNSSKILIFDEPTNNLDDETTDTVSKILNSVSKSCLIIVVSHDPRLLLEVTKKLQIENGKVFSYTCRDKQKNITPVMVIKSNLKYDASYFKRTFFSKMNLVTILFLVLMTIVIGNISNSILGPKIPINPIIGNNNYLELLNIGSVCGEGYDDSNLTASNLCVNNELFSLNDIKELSMLPYVKKIYIFDSFYDSRETKLETTPFDAIPTSISKSPYQERAYGCSVGFLVSGKVPKDNTNEFMTSIRVLQERFGINDSINNLVGNEIVIRNEKMKLVGIIENDIICLAFNNLFESSIVEYSDENSKRLLTIESQLGEISQQEGFDRVFIDFKGENYDDIIEYISIKGPSYQINSDVFTKQIQMRQFFKNWVILFLGAIGISIVLGVVLNVFTKKSYIYMKNELSDLSDLTFEYGKERVVIHQITIIDMMLAFIISIPIFVKLIESKVILIMTFPFIIISYVLIYSLLILLRSYASKDIST